MRHFPVFLDLAAGPVVLVGSGAAALAKLRLLRAANASVRWSRDPDTVDLSDAMAVIAADGSAADEVIAARARALRIPVNVVDRPELSTFIVPAIVDRGEVVVAIGTGGLAPVLARGDADPDRFPFLRAIGAPVIRAPGVAAVTIAIPAAREAA